MAILTVIGNGLKISEDKEIIIVYITLDYAGARCQVNWNNKNANQLTTNSYYVQPPIAYISTWPKVQDQVRGYYSCSLTGWSIVLPQCNVFKRAALIVESPHKYEFDDNFKPLAPLNGASGKRFCGHIIKHLNAWLPPQNHIGTCLEIKIFNPIQYQASLYHFINGLIPYDLPNVSAKYTRIDRDMRDAVWKFLYCTCNLKQDFISRLSAYNPDYIINCCTGKKRYTTFGSINPPRTPSGGDLKELVRDELYGNPAIQKYNKNYLEDSHPCAWS